MKRLFDTRREEEIQEKLSELVARFNKSMISGNDEEADKLDNEMKRIIKNRNLDDLMKLEVNKMYQRYLADKEFYKEHIEKLEKFVEIAKNEGLEISKSPYSESLYATKKGEEITWGDKPEGSYRFADHWNWKDCGIVETTHCPAKDIGREEVAVGKFINGMYHKI